MCVIFPEHCWKRVSAGEGASELVQEALAVHISNLGQDLRVSQGKGGDDIEVLSRMMLDEPSSASPSFLLPQLPDLTLKGVSQDEG